MSAFFSRRKESNGANSISDSDNILGHIDEIISQRLSVQISWGGNQARANVVSIEEDEQKIKISSLEDLDIASGNQVTIGFPLDGTWLEFSSAFTKEPSGLFVAYPSYIEPQERRREVRSTFSPREDVSAALLESFGKGVGIHGSLDNICPSAFCVRVLRAMDISSEREIRFHENILKTGQEFMLCRLKGIPGVPMIECGGKVLRVARRGYWQLVMEFSKLAPELKNAISQFTQSRNMPYQPVTRSYKRKKELRQEMEKQSAQRSEETMQATAEPQSAPLKTKEAPTSESPLDPVPQDHQAGQKSETERIDLPIKLVRRLQDGPAILTLGDQLTRDLAFLSSLGNHWKPCLSVKELIRTLQNLKSAILIIPISHNEQSVLEYMDKLAATGAMEHITLFLLAERGLTPVEVLLCKKVKVKRVFPFPLTELEPFLSAILSVQMNS